MIKLEISANSAEELGQQVSALSAIMGGMAPAKTVKAPAAKAQPAAAAATDDDTTADPDPIDEVAIRALSKKLVDAGKSEQIKELLKKSYKGVGLSKVLPKDYDAFYADLKTLL